MIFNLIYLIIPNEIKITNELVSKLNVSLFKYMDGNAFIFSLLMYIYHNTFKFQKSQETFCIFVSRR